jgi:hypothetical protein
MSNRAVIVMTFALAAISGDSCVSAAEVFRVGLYGPDDRATTCLTGPQGSVFTMTAWVLVPNERGLAYVTLRLDFPDNIDFSQRPVFNDLVSDVIFSDFPDGTAEWNMLVGDCPSGWILVYSQEISLLDDQPAVIGLVGDRSLARDCSFILNGVTVTNELTVNDPGCEVVPASVTNWGTLKSRYR